MRARDRWSGSSRSRPPTRRCSGAGRRSAPVPGATVGTRRPGAFRARGHAAARTAPRTARSTGIPRLHGSAPAGPEHAGARPGRGSGERSPGERGRRARDPRKATLGSTTYDGAGEATEPAWDGADWYGPASGTYWTLNPKEYADPRKHGPEYLARARAARSRGPRGRPPLDAASTGSQDGDPVPPAAAEADRPAPPTSNGPPDAPPAPGARPAPDVPPAASAPGVPPAPPVTVDGSAARTAPVAGRPGLRRRLERLGDAARRRLAPRSRRSSR